MSVGDVFLPLIVPFLVLNCIVVILRVATRLSSRSAGYDDLAMVLSLIGFFMFSIMLLECIHYGIVADDVKPYYNSMLATKIFTIVQIVYCITSGLCKLAVALVLLRLTSRSNMMVIRVIIIALQFTNIVFCLVLTFIFAFQCRPLAMAWGGATEGTCMSTSLIGRAGLALSIEEVIISWAYALLPIYMLWKTDIPIKVKIVVILLLGLGAVSSVATIVRLKYIIIIQNQTNSEGLTDSIQTAITACIYSFLELALSIFASALAALRPLLRKIAFFSDVSSGRSGKKTGDNYNLRTIGQISGTRRRADGAITLNDSDPELDGESQCGIVTTQPWPKDTADSLHGKTDAHGQ